MELVTEYSQICVQDECTGCMACANACQHSAIVIKTDSLGFRYPLINTSSCVNCGLCRKVCPQLEKPEFNYPRKCYAALSKKILDRISCASGGIATVLGRDVLKRGGIVVGCSSEEIRNVRHIIADSLEKLDLLKGSKYVQSHISQDLLRNIRSQLISGRQVLFIGTGCQVAGLKSFLLTDYSNLLTVDLVCHGVPSQQLLDDDLERYSKKNLTFIKFRRKEIENKNSETDGSTSIRFGISAKQKFRNGISPKLFWIPWYKDPYLGSFMSGISFRRGCYKCLYARPERQSDITVCDFWGLSKTSNLYGKVGVSAVLINSEEGEKVFDRISSEIDFEIRPIEEAVKGNGQLRSPSQFNPLRKEFITLYQKYGLNIAYRRTVFRSMLWKHYKTVLAPILYPPFKVIKKIFGLK